VFPLGPCCRRGLAGTILVHIVAGAAAESGGPLAEVAAQARAASLRTVAVALSTCTVPTAGQPGFVLGDNEIELGLSIHGEPGVRRGPLESADTLIDRLLDVILADLSKGNGDPVVLTVNNSRCRCCRSTITGWLGSTLRRMPQRGRTPPLGHGQGPIRKRARIHEGYDFHAAVSLLERLRHPTPNPTIPKENPIPTRSKIAARP